MSAAITSIQKARKKYEQNKRGPVAMRIVLTAHDDKDVWEKVKKGMKEKYGSVKQGILELAKKDSII